MPYRPMCAEDYVFIPQSCTNANCDGFLPLVLMQCSGDKTLQKQPIKVVFKPTNERHSLVHHHPLVTVNDDVAIIRFPAEMPDRRPKRVNSRGCGRNAPLMKSD